MISSAPEGSERLSGSLDPPSFKVIESAAAHCYQGKNLSKVNLPNDICWWFRNPANQLSLVVYPGIYSALYILSVVIAGYPNRQLYLSTGCLPRWPFLLTASIRSTFGVATLPSTSIVQQLATQKSLFQHKKSKEKCRLTTRISPNVWDVSFCNSIFKDLCFINKPMS